jgi:hypothetical protein
MHSKPGHRTQRRWPGRSWLVAGLVALANSGCSQTSEELRGRLHILVTTPSHEALSNSEQDNILSPVRLLASEFNKLHPKVSFTFSVTRERELEPLLARRQAMGLGPDLVLTSNTSAVGLDAKQLTQAVSLKASLANQLDHAALQRLRRKDQSLAGIPMTSYPDLACFNTKAIPSSPPQTLQQLLVLEKRGLESGFALEDRHLLWTAGALGSDGAIAELLLGEPLTTQRSIALRRWLSWLRNANQVAGIYFLNSMNQLAEQLEEGKLDWIMCNSMMIPQLRQALGANLGISLLPGGADGEPSRIIRQHVWAFARGRSQEQHDLAMTLVHFSVNSPFQSLFSLKHSNSLPVNTVVAPQTAHQAATVRTMVQASRHSAESLALSESIARYRNKLKSTNQLLRQVIDSEITLDEGLQALINILQHSQ